MANDDQLFQPDTVDEQLEYLTNLAAKDEPGAPTIAALQDIYAEDELTLTRAWSRIESQEERLQSTDDPVKVIAHESHDIAEAPVSVAVVKEEPGTTASQPASVHLHGERQPRSMYRRLVQVSLVAAAALVFFNVFGWVLYTHAFQQNSKLNTVVGVAATPIPKVTPGVKNLYSCSAWVTNTNPVYSSNGIVMIYAKLVRNYNATPVGVSGADVLATVYWPYDNKPYDNNKNGNQTNAITYIHSTTDTNGLVLIPVSMIASAIGGVAFVSVLFVMPDNIVCNATGPNGRGASFTETAPNS